MGNKPALIIQDDFQGEHNKDLNATRTRLLKGGTWRRQRIVVILPSADLIPAKVALSHWNLAFPPNNGVLRILGQGMEVGDAYSTAIEQVISHPDLRQWEYILVLEHDNLVPSDGVLKLLERMEEHPEFSALSASYFCKGVSGCLQAWGSVDLPENNFMPQLPDPNGGLVECRGLGMGMCLFRLSMFKDERLRKPWFVTQKEGGVSTQDLYFWNDARKYGYRCAVDCSVKSGHYDYKGDFGPPDFVW